MMDLDDALKYAQNALERAFEDWLESERPSGDCESVHRRWDESFAHQELADELQPVLALTWEVRRLREENERLRGWIRVEGGFNDTCTRQILGEVCHGCRCGKTLPEPAP